MVQASWPVATASELMRTRVPWRLYACSRRSRRPGWAGLGGALRSSTCIPVFSSQHITRRPCLRSEEHTSELQSPCNLVCRLLLEKKKKVIKQMPDHIDV